MKAHDYLVRALITLETMPVFEHGEAAAVLIGDLFFVVDALALRCDAGWVRSLRHDFRTLLELFVEGTRPALVALKRARVIEGLKRALEEKVL